MQSHFRTLSHITAGLLGRRASSVKGAHVWKNLKCVFFPVGFIFSFCGRVKNKRNVEGKVKMGGGGEKKIQTNKKKGASLLSLATIVHQC